MGCRVTVRDLGTLGKVREETPASGQAEREGLSVSAGFTRYFFRLALVPT